MEYKLNIITMMFNLYSIDIIYVTMIMAVKKYRFKKNNKNRDASVLSSNDGFVKSPIS